MSFSLRSRESGFYLSVKPGTTSWSIARHTLAWELFTTNSHQLHGDGNTLIALRLVAKPNNAGTFAIASLEHSAGHFLSVNPHTRELSVRDKSEGGPQSWEWFDKVDYCSLKTPRQHKQELKNNGFTIVQRLFAAEAQMLKAQVSHAEDEQQKNPDDTQWTKPDGTPKLQVRVGQVMSLSEEILNASCHPLITGLLTKVVGPNFRCATFSANTLLQQDSNDPEDTGLGWHVDYPYHDLDPGYWGEVDSPLGVQVLICLDEFTSANGGTMFRTNTHKLLKSPDYVFDTPAPDGVFCCEQLGRLKTPDGAPDGYVPDCNITKYHPCPPGSVLIAHSAWWHRQVRNVDSCGGEHPRRRTALLGNYTPGHVVPKGDMGAVWREIQRRGWKLPPMAKQLCLGSYERGVCKSNKHKKK